MKILQILCIGIFYLFVFVSPSFATNHCAPNDTRVECKFGTISPPPALKDFIGGDPSGAGAISRFLSNFVLLIFSVAAIVLIFMLLWGAFDWIISEGDKEKIAAARSKIIHAIIGIMLFAVAFAVIAILGTFTGFKFFKGQNIQVTKDYIICPNGDRVGPPTLDPVVACRGHEN